MPLNTFTAHKHHTLLGLGHTEALVQEEQETQRNAKALCFLTMALIDFSTHSAHAPCTSPQSPYKTLGPTSTENLVGYQYTVMLGE